MPVELVIAPEVERAYMDWLDEFIRDEHRQSEEARTRERQENSRVAPFQDEWNALKDRLRRACADYNLKIGNQAIVTTEGSELNAAITAAKLVLRIDHYEDELEANYSFTHPTQLMITNAIEDVSGRSRRQIWYGSSRIYQDGSRMVYEPYSHNNCTVYDNVDLLAQDRFKFFLNKVRLEQHPEERPRGGNFIRAR
jgi:hypothetical protein